MTVLARAALTASLVLALAACGSDDHAAGTAATIEAPVATEAPGTTEAPVATVADEGDAAGFCAAELEIEAAINSEDDPSAAIGQALAAAPAYAKPALETVLAEVEASGGESEAFAVAYGEMIGWTKGNCGYGLIEATTTEYAFAGIPDDVPAGPTIVTMTNLGEEFHEVLLMRKNDGVTESFEEILALGDEESQGLVTVASVAFGPPGAEAYSAADLPPDEYVAICSFARVQRLR